MFSGKVDVFVQKVVVFGQKVLYSVKSGCIREEWLNSVKICCIRAKWWYF